MGCGSASEFIKDLVQHSTVLFASLFFVSPDCRVQCQSRVHLRVRKKNLQVLSKSVGAKCGGLSAQQVGVAVKWYYWAVMGFRDWLFYWKLNMLMGLVSKLSEKL